jgi:hypothetical protein
MQGNGISVFSLWIFFIYRFNPFYFLLKNKFDFQYRNPSKTGLGKNPGNSKKPMGMGKTGFYREKWEKREKLPFFKIYPYCRGIRRIRIGIPGNSKYI